MEKFTKILKHSYIFLILGIFYIPIFFMTVFSFNQSDDKGRAIFTVWNGFSWDSWKELGSSEFTSAFANSFLIGTIVALIVTVIALLVVYGLWRQKAFYKNTVDATANIILINPDVITAIALAITLSSIFGTLSVLNEGIIRVILSHVILTLPYAILLLYPRSEKFDKSLLEASQDLGYNHFQSWLRIYLRFMMPIILITMGVCLTLSFDDFILTRIVSNTSTVATRLYEGSYKGWSMALGSILLIVILISVIITNKVRSLKWKSSQKL